LSVVQQADPAGRQEMLVLRRGVDLHAMSQGRMDSSGQGLTIAGLVVGSLYAVVTFVVLGVGILGELVR
jgi:hypothetical protein